MKNIFLMATLASLMALFASCSEDGYIKVFKCSELYPYFNTVDNRCYKTKEDADKANKKAEQDKKDANKKDGEETSAQKAESDGPSGDGGAD